MTEFNKIMLVKPGRSATELTPGARELVGVLVHAPGARSETIRGLGGYPESVWKEVEEAFPKP